MKKFMLILISFIFFVSITAAQENTRNGAVIVAESDTQAPLDAFIDAVPSEWVTSSQETARYEIKLTSTFTELERCQYQPTGVVIREQIDVEATLTDLENKVVIGTHLFNGDYPDFCGMTESFTLGSSTKHVTGNAHPADFEQWLIETMRANGTDLQLPQVPAEILLTLFGYNASFDPEGDRIILVRDHAVIIVKLDSGDELQKIVLEDTFLAFSASFSPDSSHILVLGRNPGDYQNTIQIWDATTGEKQTEINSDACRASFSPDGKQIIGSCYVTGAYIYDAETGKQINTFGSDITNMTDASYSPDGQSIAVASMYVTFPLTIWNVDKGEKILTLGEDTGTSFYDVQYSKDGETIVTTTDDGLIQLWDMTKGIKRLELSGHSGNVFVAQFNQEGNLVLSAGRDNTVRIWDVQKGLQLLQLPTGEISILSVSFSPDGTKALVSSSAGITQLWDVSDISSASSS